MIIRSFMSSNFQIYLGKTDNPPSIKLDNFTDLIFRFSGLPADTADWPPHYHSAAKAGNAIQLYILYSFIYIYCHFMNCVIWS